MKAEHSHPQQLQIRDLTSIVWRHKGILFSFVFGTVILAVIYSLLATPIYSASAQLLISRDNPQITSVEKLLNREMRQTDFLETQRTLLMSRTLIKSVVIKLDLKDSEEFKPRKNFIDLSPIKNAVVTFLKDIIGREKSGSEVPLDPYTKTVTALQKRLKVLQLKKSRVVQITYEGYSPSLSAEIVNTLVRTFIDRNIEWQSNIEQGTGDWLALRVKEVSKQLKESEQELQRFREKTNILEIDDKRDFTNQKLTRTLADISKARADRLQWQELLRQVEKLKSRPKEMFEALPDNLKSANIVRLHQQYIDLKRELSVASKTYGSNHPTIIKLKQQLQAIETRIPEEMNGLVQRVRNNFKSYQDIERRLESSLEEQKKSTIELDRYSIEFKSLKQEVEANKKLYELLVEKMKKVNVSSQVDETFIRIVDPAEIPVKPSKPNKVLNVIVAFVVGMFGGLLFIGFKEGNDNTIKGERDLERSLPFPILGSIKYFNKKDGPFPIESFSSACGTEFRDMVSNLRWLLNKPKTVLMVTSTLCGEGKATVAANLGIGIAKTGKSALVVDCDVRQPKLEKIFNAKRDPGLVNYLKGEFGLKEVIQSTNFQHTYMMATGSVGKDVLGVSELYQPDKFQMTIEKFKEVFDVVILITQPAGKFSDASFLKEFCDGVVYVVEVGKYEPVTVKKAIDLLMMPPTLAGPLGYGNHGNGGNGSAHNGDDSGQIKIGLILNKVE